MLIHELTAKECREELARAHLGRLACARDNQPYIVPIHFVFDDEDIYSFSMLGQKIEWMRDNPRVCLEVERIVRANEWTTLVVYGRYEELRDADEPGGRQHAHELLQRRAMWWEPGAATVEHRGDETSTLPVFFRITVDRITGHRALPET